MPRPMTAADRTPEVGDVLELTNYLGRPVLTVGRVEKTAWYPIWDSSVGPVEGQSHAFAESFVYKSRADGGKVEVE